MAQPFFSALDSLSVRPEKQMLIRDLSVTVPAGWELKQSLLDNGVSILRMTNGLETLQFYAREGSIGDAKAIFVNESKLLGEMSATADSIHWNEYLTSKNGLYTVGFEVEMGGTAYYGFTSASSADVAERNASTFLNGVQFNRLDSLTGPEYKGKKYYLGWGAAMPSDQSEMHNEVKYDVLHTHDIFTKDVGGNYIGSKFTSYKDSTSSNITGKWNELKNVMTPDDMYVQYSSGHGSPSGLAVGVNYNQIRDAVLGLHAKETVVFIMACYSGGLVESFNQKKSEWQNFQSQGRTLFVMSSSSKSQSSSTGPGTDPAEPGGPDGSAGSAFGYSLWQALIGKADGTVDGVKDGYLSLDEIEQFTTSKTQEVGGHKPTHTGAYDPKLIMNRVPPHKFIESLEHSTE
jgi:hypothetical protein